MNSPIARLNDFGQSPWYDNLTRTLVSKGGLNQLISEDGIRGVTSNPTIFEKAMASGAGYDDQLATLAAQGASVDDIYWELVLTDVGHAADILRPTHDRLDGRDGFVSVEVSPLLAHDTDATIEQAAWLWNRLDRPNILIKIPATKAGLPAITETIAAGINVNVTLIFSLERYQAVLEAYVEGLRKLRANGGDISKVHSVGSFFVSRLDTEVDRRLPESSALRGRAAVANAKLAYEVFAHHIAGEEWGYVADAANPQRPLWASTSTKNPAYSDTLYVDDLVGPDSVNTLAQPSIDALRDHGDPKPNTITDGVDAARALVEQELPAAGVDYADVVAVLEREGVASFAQSFHDCLASLDKRRIELVG
ncbi:MAG: transaldolase [Acidimicrobiia bacterium]